MVSIPFLVCLMESLQDFEDTSVTDICLDGMRFGIHIAGILNIEVRFHFLEFFCLLKYHLHKIYITCIVCLQTA